MPAQVLSMYTQISIANAKDWRQSYYEHLDGVLDTIEGGAPMEKLWEITDAVFKNKSEILGKMAVGLIESQYPQLVDQEEHTCPGCAKTLKRRGKHTRRVHTLLGEIPLERPYFYCADCEQGFYPLDEALSLGASPKHYDVQDLEAWLGSELPFDTAAQAFERCTGGSASAQNVHACANRIAKDLTILDVCPTKAEVEAKVATVRAGRFRRPVLMLAIDAASAPTRPEPSPRKGKRGKGEYKDVKGFRLYVLDEQRMEPLISWHQAGRDRDLAADLDTIKGAGLIPEAKARLCIIGDGAPWIWNRIHEIFPNAKEVLDFYHCSEHLHTVAHAQPTGPGVGGSEPHSAVPQPGAPCHRWPQAHGAPIG